MRDHNASTRKAQARTLVTADAWGQPWDAEDLAMVLEFSDETAEELATALGRTVYAVQSVREALRKGQAIGGGERRSTPATRQAQAWALDDPRWG